MAATIVFTLAIAESAASAAHLSLTNRSIRTAITNMEFYTGEFFERSNEVRCPVILEGSFHSVTLPKTRGIEVGQITRAVTTAASCVGIGRQGFEEARLPWSIRYWTYNGTLPNPDSINFRLGPEMEFRITEIPLIQPCRYRGEVAIAFSLDGSGQAVFTTFNDSIPLVAGSNINCPQPYNWNGAAVVTLLGTSNIIRVRLI